MKKNTMQLLSWGTTIFAVLCGLIAFCMIFVKAINTPYSLSDSFSGLQVALGCSTTNGYPIFKASAGLILAFVFPMIGACTAMLGKGYKIVTIVASAFMVTGGALALSCLHLLNPAIILMAPTLAAGPIASGVLSLVGGVTLCGSLFIKN